MLIYDDVSKKCQVVFKNCYGFLKVLNYLVCVSSSKSINSTPLFKKKKKKMVGIISLPPYCQRLRDQDTLLGMGLVELAVPSEKLNYKPSFKHCILKTILHVFLLFIYVWNKIFCSKN